MTMPGTYAHLVNTAWEWILFPHLTSLAGSRFSYLESRESCKSGLPMKSKYWSLSEKVFKDKTVNYSLLRSLCLGCALSEERTNSLSFGTEDFKE